MALGSAGNAGNPGYNDYMGGMGALFGSGLGGLFSNYDNPANAGMPYLNQMGGDLNNYLSPYMQHGEDMYNPLAEQLRRLMGDPGGRLNQIGAGYHQSPGFDFALKQSLKSGSNAAAAGGMAGTPQHQQQAMTTATGLADQDYNQWMNNALGLYNGGLSGAQNIYGIGANSANSLAQLQSQLAQKQAELAYEGQNAQNQHSGGIWGSLLGGGAGMLMGGPFGAALGNKMGGWFGGGK